MRGPDSCSWCRRWRRSGADHATSDRDWGSAQSRGANRSDNKRVVARGRCIRSPSVGVRHSVIGDLHLAISDKLHLPRRSVGLNDKRIGGSSCQLGAVYEWLSVVGNRADSWCSSWSWCWRWRWRRRRRRRRRRSWRWRRRRRGSRCWSRSRAYYAKIDRDWGSAHSRAANRSDHKRVVAHARCARSPSVTEGRRLKGRDNDLAISDKFHLPRRGVGLSYKGILGSNCQLRAVYEWLSVVGKRAYSRC